MKTRHVFWTDGQGIIDAIRIGLHETNSNKNALRVVNCGRGVVILPDTNRKQDCTEGEIIKALGLTKKCNCLHFEQNKPRFNYMIEHPDGSIDYAALTEDQVRLLDWLCEKGAFWDELIYHSVNPDSFEEV